MDDEDQPKGEYSKAHTAPLRDELLKGAEATHGLCRWSARVVEADLGGIDGR